MNKKAKSITPFKSAYDASVRSVAPNVGESMTQQHFTEECDIHNIIKRHDTDGIIMSVNKGQAIYGDFSEVTDFTEALDLIKNASENFMQIPSQIRKRFDNDAGKFFNYAQDPKNFDELIELGLATKKVPSSPVEEGKSEVETNVSASPDTVTT